MKLPRGKSAGKNILRQGRTIYRNNLYSEIYTIRALRIKKQLDEEYNNKSYWYVLPICLSISFAITYFVAFK